MSHRTICMCWAFYLSYGSIVYAHAHAWSTLKLHHRQRPQINLIKDWPPLCLEYSQPEPAESDMKAGDKCCTYNIAIAFTNMYILPFVYFGNSYFLTLWLLVYQFPKNTSVFLCCICLQENICTFTVFIVLKKIIDSLNMILGQSLLAPSGLQSSNPEWLKVEIAKTARGKPSGNNQVHSF